MSNVRMIGAISNAVPVKLSYLEYVNFEGNSLTGTIYWQWGIIFFDASHEIAHSKNLENLPVIKNFEVSGNIFSESFPPTINSAITLEVIDVSFNNLTGDFPVLSGLQSIKYLDIRENNFTGTFPTGYFSETNFVQLRYVGLNENPYLVVPNVCVRIPFCYKRTSLFFYIGGQREMTMKIRDCFVTATIWRHHNKPHT